MRKKLKWGQTPWDDMSREDLLREVQRMFSAMQSARSVMGMVRGPEPDLTSFWGPLGTGGRAFEKCEQVIKPLAAQFNLDSLYGGFYRYADDLLFAGVGSEWAVCPKCGRMIGSGRNAPSSAGKPCFHPECGATMRPLEWSDLSPEHAAQKKPSTA